MVFYLVRTEDYGLTYGQVENKELAPKGAEFFDNEKDLEAQADKLTVELNDQQLADIDKLEAEILKEIGEIEKDKTPPGQEKKEVKDER